MPLELELRGLGGVVVTLELLRRLREGEGLGDDDVFGAKQEAPKDAVTKALGALSGKVSSEKAVSDAAMRAMFAKKAARTIHDSLKQKAKRMFILVYTRLID